MENISNLDNQLFHFLCKIDSESTSDVVQQMAGCLDRDILDLNKDIISDVRERYYEHLIAKGVTNQEVLVPKRRSGHGHEANKDIARDIVQLYLYATRQTAEIPHETISGIGFNLDMSNRMEQTENYFKTESLLDHRGSATCMPSPRQ